MRDHPNDYWGVNNLFFVYRRLSRFDDALTVKRADLVPNNFVAQVQSAEALVINRGDLSGARRLVDRARALLPSLVVVPNDNFVAWVAHFSAFQHWAAGRLDETAHLLTQRLEHSAVVNPDLSHAATGMLELTLGRIRRAEDTFRRMSLNSHRQSLLAYAALARGDREGAVAALRGDPRHFDSAATAPGADLRGHYGWTTLAFSAMRRAGLIDEAEAYARRVPSDATERGFWDGELAAARGDLEAAWRALESQIALYEAGLPSTLIAVNTLVDVYVQRGELQRADALLQRFHSLRATAYPMPGSRGLEWLRTRARAAGVLRRLGKHAEAEATERALRELLRFADSDLVLLPDTARRE